MDFPLSVSNFELSQSPFKPRVVQSQTSDVANWLEDSIVSEIFCNLWSIHNLIPLVNSLSHFVHFSDTNEYINDQIAKPLNSVCNFVNFVSFLIFSMKNYSTINFLKTSLIFILCQQNILHKFQAMKLACFSSKKQRISGHFETSRWRYKIWHFRH